MFYKQFLKIIDTLDESFVEEFDFWLATLPERLAKTISVSAIASRFAQLYKINLSPKMHRSPTLRLVVLDEAFSKMDAEKVASCISLIRGLGFQAIISATNDKIQNYLENVDKTFVYANPNKRHISIQEFEKTEFGELAEE